MNHFKQLQSYVKDISALGYIAAILSWDNATNMPRGAVNQRSISVGALSNEIHRRKKSSRIPELLDKIDVAKLTAVEQAQVREIERMHKRAAQIPDDLARATAEAVEQAEAQWQVALKENNFQLFKPNLKQVVALKREEGTVLARDGGVYDALLSEYESGMTEQNLDTLFGILRPRLESLRDKIMAKERGTITLDASFSKEKQLGLARLLARKFGYDVENGRIDLVVHPFCTGNGNDVRITTRVDEKDPLNCLYSTIHESGHGSYEQNINKEYLFTAIGGGASFGVHESQSRICENQLARSKPFTGWLFRQMNETFGDFGIDDAMDFYRFVNQVKRGFVRTEADEVQYNLHIIMRYELERDLISGSLDAEDAEDAWNEKFKNSFGYAVDEPTLGVLQDVHWSYGLFGYFPTYTLGNVYAGCLFEAMQHELTDLNTHLARGDPSPATNWLKKHIHKYGSLREPTPTIQKATSCEISPEPLLNYLELKFTELYDL